MSGVQHKRLWQAFKRGTAFFTVASFLVANIKIQASFGFEIPPAEISIRPPLADPSEIVVPRDIGIIEEVFKGQEARFVILVKDAHAVPDAQRNIQKLIDHFQKQYGVNSIFVEGAASKLDPQIFRSFPDKRLLREALDAYHKEGELTGSTAAAILSETEASYRSFQ